jgi:hypothetical protein
MAFNYFVKRAIITKNISFYIYVILVTSMSSFLKCAEMTPLKTRDLSFTPILVLRKHLTCIRGSDRNIRLFDTRSLPATRQAQTVGNLATDILIRTAIYDILLS